MRQIFFITGISTDVGKTITSAIFAQALKADYWKPIQSGDLEYSDSHKILELVDFDIKIHPNSYALKRPISPHASAQADGISIDLENIILPTTSNTLIIEPAGGLLVPINSTNTIIDLIKPDYKVVVVSRHYLGSINHTLMTLQILKSSNISISGIVFSGKKNKDTESIIIKMGGCSEIFRIEEEPHFDRNRIRYYADKYKSKILDL